MTYHLLVNLNMALDHNTRSDCDFATLWRLFRARDCNNFGSMKVNMKSLQ